jgi:glycosyltransferase involved in cell wall biosynthesis
MKIAILGTRGVPSGYSGYEEFAEQLGSRLIERGHEITVYCRASVFKERPPTYRGIKLVYLPSIETKQLSTYSAAAVSMLHVLSCDYDALLVCNVANSPFCLLPKLFGKRIAINVDGLEWLRPKWGTLAKCTFRFSAQIAKYTTSIIVTDAEAMRRRYLGEFGAESVAIAYGANIETSEHPEILEQYGVKPGGYFFIACRLVPDNNVDLILQAFSQVKTEKKFAVAGGVPYKSPYADRLKQVADGRALFLGHIDNWHHIKELHCNAYAYVHGHEFGGTNPTLLKALGFGNCVLALNTVFNRETLAGGYGILYEKDVEDLRHKMQAIVDEPERQAAMAQRAPDRIREAYTWEHITDQYEALFRQVSQA